MPDNDLSKDREPGKAGDVCSGCGGYRAAVLTADDHNRDVRALTGPEHQDLDDRALLAVAIRAMADTDYRDETTGAQYREEDILIDLWTPQEWHPVGECGT